MTTETEMLMNSVERVHEYTKLEREPNKHPDGRYPINMVNLNTATTEDCVGWQRGLTST